MYLGLSALDFPFCFIAVRLLGVERIGHWEHVVVQTVKDAFYSVWPVEDGGKGEGEGEEDSALVKQERSMEEASMFSLFLPIFAILRISTIRFPFMVMN